MSVLPLTVVNVNQGDSTSATTGAHGADAASRTGTADGAGATSALGAGEAAITHVPLANLEYAVVDVETTGWSPEDAGITEIGAVRVRRGQIAAEFTSLVNPGISVPEDIVELTGISDEMLTLAPSVVSVMPGLLAFAEDCVLIAHNARFDVSFLHAASVSAGLPWPDFAVIDTVRLARQLMAIPDEVPDCKLSTLAGYFGTPVQPIHRALADARATASVLGALLGRLADNGIYTIAQLTPWLEEREAAQAAAAEAAGAERGQESGGTGGARPRTLRAAHHG
jgi:DNA polymerase III epsilon subunit family exonuclease